jgi:hypothetical protein
MTSRMVGYEFSFSENIAIRLPESARPCKGKHRKNRLALFISLKGFNTLIHNLNQVTCWLISQKYPDLFFQQFGGEISFILILPEGMD